VEGSVRRSGDKLRVTAQLIRAHDGFHLWSETYDSDTEDLFDVQHDVAENIAASLDVILDDEKRNRMFAAGTRNVAAFEAYIKGRKLFDQAHTRDTSTLVTLADANVYLEQAMELDPGFAQPAILHSDRYAHILIEPGAMIAGDINGLNDDSAHELLMRDLDFAVDNAPDTASRVVAELNREYFAPHWHRMPSLLIQLRKIVEGGVPMPEGVVWLQEILLLNQEIEIAEILAKRRQLSDPLNMGGWQDEADIRLQQRDFEGMATLFEQIRGMFGDSPVLIEREIYSALLQGDKTSVLELLQDDFDFSGDYNYLEPLLLALQGDHDGAIQLINEAQSKSTWQMYGSLMIYEEIGDADRMRELVSRVDALETGPTMLAIDLTIRGRILRFDLNDTPRLKKRLEEAQIDPASFAR
jgi:tetratricopeptide (TPR) repeat protein